MVLIYQKGMYQSQIWFSTIYVSVVVVFLIQALGGISISSTLIQSLRGIGLFENPPLKREWEFIY